MKKLIILFVLTLTSVILTAGDLAVLENLGFSPDGRYFMFGQHVLIPKDGKAYAETAIVNVSQNTFVSNGWKKKSWKIQMLPNQDSRGALYEILRDMIDLKDRYGINHLNQGRLLYTKSYDDEKPADNEFSSEIPVLTFRDFSRGTEYILQLEQSNQTTGDSASAAFHILVTIENADGHVAQYTVGRPSYMRPDVVSYSIARVWIAPNARSLVIGVLKEYSDLSARYMVETLTLN